MTKWLPSLPERALLKLPLFAVTGNCCLKRCTVFVRRKRTRNGRRWRRAFIVLVGLALIIGIGTLTYGQATSADTDEMQFTVQSESQIYAEDVVISEGDVLNEDVVVYSGDVRVKADGLINGDLVVYSGDVTVEAKGEIRGDVTALSGDADIAGVITGDLAVWSGDVDLAESASIGGNLSVMSGKIDRESGSIVRGNVVAGGLKLPQLPSLWESLQAPAPPVAPAVPAVDMTIARSGGIGNMLFHWIGRLFLAAFGASLIILLTGLIYYVRPNFVHAVQQTLEQQRPLSFVVGFVVNLVLTFLTGVLVITLCLAPVGFAAGLLFAAINLVGWAALSLTVGQWILRAAKIETQPLVALLVGAFLMTGVLAIGWSIGGCLRPLIYLASLVMTAFGGGAVVVYWLRLGATSNADTTTLSV